MEPLDTLIDRTVGEVVDGSVAGQAGPLTATAVDVLILMVLAGIYGARTIWLRYAHHRERSCRDPLHRAEASARAAVAQTALVLGVAAATLVGLPVPWVVPVWLLQGWPSVIVGALAGGPVVLGAIRWRERRERELGFTVQECWL